MKLQGVERQSRQGTGAGDQGFLRFERQAKQQMAGDEQPALRGTPDGILRTGEVLQFVNFNDRAWHAGRSTYLAQKECNDYSIGIELEGSDDLPFEAAQYAVLTEVVACLQQAYPKIQQHIAGHSDIAPGRKTDPGPFFEWNAFRQQLHHFKNK